MIDKFVLQETSNIKSLYM